MASTETVGINGNYATGDGCDQCNYVLGTAFTTTAPLTAYTFTPNATGTITPVLFSSADSNGQITFTVTGVGATQTIDGSELGTQQTFGFDVASGSDLVTPGAYFGFQSSAYLVGFNYSDPPAVGSYLFATETPTLGEQYSANCDASCGAQYNQYYAFNDRDYDMTAVAATPEPGSLALLGTGLLGMAGVARRRFVCA